MTELTVADALIVSAPEAVAEAGDKVTEATPWASVRAVVELSAPSAAFTANVTTTPGRATPVLLLTVAVAVAGDADETVDDDSASVMTGAVEVVVVPPELVEPVDESGAPPALQPAIATAMDRPAAAASNFLFLMTLPAVTTSAPDIAFFFVISGNFMIGALDA